MKQPVEHIEAFSFILFYAHALRPTQKSVNRIGNVNSP